MLNVSLTKHVHHWTLKHWLNCVSGTKHVFIIIHTHINLRADPRKELHFRVFG